MWSDDPVVGVTNLWRSSFQTVTGGATISFQLDKFTRLIVCPSFYCILPKEIHRYYHNRWLNKMNFLVAYPATLAAKRERLIVFRCVIEKKELPKKNVITKNGVNRIPTYCRVQSQGPRTQTVRLYLWSSPIFGKKMLRKLSNARGPKQCKSIPGKNMVSRRNHLLYHYSLTIDLHPVSFYATILLKKISQGKCSINKLLNLNWGGMGSLALYVLQQLLFSWQTKISTEYLQVNYFIIYF